MKTKSNSLECEVQYHSDVTLETAARLFENALKKEITLLTCPTIKYRKIVDGVGGSRVEVIE